MSCLKSRGGVTEFTRIGGEGWGEGVVVGRVVEDGGGGGCLLAYLLLWVGVAGFYWLSYLILAPFGSGEF